MSDSIQFDMNKYRLPRVVACGFVETRSAHLLPLREVAYDGTSDHHLGLTLWGKTSGRAGDVSLLSIEMYRLPKGRAEFDSKVKFFGDERKKWARLPEGVRFGPTILAPQGVPVSWVHDGFPRSGHDVIHAYASQRQAMLIRYRGKKMLDNDLFRRVNRNLSVVEGRWEAAPPACRPRAGLKPGAIERPLKLNVVNEVSEAIQRGYDYLKLKPGRAKPAKVRQAIYDAVDRLIAAKRRVPAEQADDLAIDLGCLWGQSLCDSLGWAWCQLKYGRGPAAYAVVSPDRSFAVAPMAYLLRQIGQRGPGADNTTLLLFNMVEAGAVPRSRPQAYKMLG